MDDDIVSIMVCTISLVNHYQFSPTVNCILLSYNNYLRISIISAHPVSV